MRIRLSPLFRLLPYLLVAALGFAIIASTGSATPAGPRLSRREQLVSLIAREDERTRALRGRLEALQSQIDSFEEVASRGERTLQALRRDVDYLRELAGLTEITGPGVRIELRDSTLRESPTGDPNDLVVHEQDLQAVVNALWAGGAEAMSINGERITATSAIRCVGNTLLLHGTVYAPPYRLDALGDSGKLLQALGEDPMAQRFRIFAQEFRLGFDVLVVPEMTLPPFRGLVAVGHATSRGA